MEAGDAKSKLGGWFLILDKKVFLHLDNSLLSRRSTLRNGPAPCTQIIKIRWYLLPSNKCSSASTWEAYFPITLQDHFPDNPNYVLLRLALGVGTIF